jgi:hypothetical protein
MVSSLLRIAFDNHRIVEGGPSLGFAQALASHGFETSTGRPKRLSCAETDPSFALKPNRVDPESRPNSSHVHGIHARTRSVPRDPARIPGRVAILISAI